MYTALRATSLTLQAFLQQSLAQDATLGVLFNPARAGAMVVSLRTPQEMEGRQQGVSLWLYRVTRDDALLNRAPERVRVDRLRRTPLPVRLHYLVTPLTDRNSPSGPETEQVILGKVLQTFHDYAILRGSSLQDDFRGTDVELNVRLEPMSLEEITRVWDALEGSYQLSVSYEVSVVTIRSERELEDISPVLVGLPEFQVVVGEE